MSAPYLPMVIGLGVLHNAQITTSHLHGPCQACFMFIFINLYIPSSAVQAAMHRFAREHMIGAPN
jgi:hypothetical protein